jgi:hypothetical protein
MIKSAEEAISRHGWNQIAMGVHPTSGKSVARVFISTTSQARQPKEPTEMG